METATIPKRRPGPQRRQQPDGHGRVTVNFRTTPETADRIRDQADREERTISVVIERAIREYLDRHSRREPAASVAAG